MSFIVTKRKEEKKKDKMVW